MSRVSQSFLVPLLLQLSEFLAVSDLVRIKKIRFSPFLSICMGFVELVSISMCFGFSRFGFFKKH